MFRFRRNTKISVNICLIASYIFFAPSRLVITIVITDTGFLGLGFFGLSNYINFTISINGVALILLQFRVMKVVKGKDRQTGGKNLITVRKLFDVFERFLNVNISTFNLEGTFKKTFAPPLCFLTFDIPLSLFMQKLSRT